jgi:hypothetical protein
MRGTVVSRVIVLLLATGAAFPVAAQRVPQLVKTSNRYVVKAPSGYDIVAMSCTPVPGYAPRSVTWGVARGDPRGPAAQVAPAGFCPYYDTATHDLFSGAYYPADGYRDYVFDAAFGSLWDVRYYDIVCAGYMRARGATYWDTAWHMNRECCPAACQTCLDICVQALTVTFPLNVYNNVPSISAMNVPSTASCPGTIALHGEAVDSDGGFTGISWVLTAPGGALSTAAGSDVTFQVTGSGTWQVRLDAEDNEGERASITRSFTTTPSAPSIAIDGRRSVAVMREPIDLTVTSASSACGTLTTTWDVVSTPPGASVAPQNGYRTGGGLAITTQGEQDIGTWVVRATSTIAGMSDTKTVSVEVTNLPPEINLDGPHRITVGGPPGVVRTTIVDDRDGGALTFDWELVQAPATAGVSPGPAFSKTSSVTIPATLGAAGTWIFRLTAKDNDGAPNSTVTPEMFDVLVDAPPQALISGPTVAMTGRPFTLDGSGSVDPDSPCPGDPARCHVVEGGGPAQRISDGLVTYAWYVDVPFEQWTRYPSGRVFDALGIADTAPSLEIPSLEPGDWVFRLEVVDAEGNAGTYQMAVAVLEAQVPPLAILTPPARYLVAGSGQIATAIAVNGSPSYDPDNAASGATGPGVGITDYEWLITPPPWCAEPMTQGGSSSVTLYQAGSAVPAECQGTWRVRLTVTDDDQPAQTGAAETEVVIGNCAGALCIDAPTTAAPAVVPAVNQTDVTVLYHIDSALYDDPAFMFGMITELSLKHELDPSHAVATQLDPNVLPTSRGGLLAFNWNGYTPSGDRAPGGFYDVRIRLLDASGGTTNHEAVMPRAIWVEVSKMTAAVAGATRYLPRDAVEAGTALPTFSYTVDGSLGVDEVRWRIRDASGAIIYQTSQLGAVSGTVAWSGYSDPASTLAPADAYAFEIDAYREGMLVAASEPVAFAFYTLRLESTVRAIRPDGVLALLYNGDDDNGNGIPDFFETSVAGEDDLVAVRLVVQPQLTGVVTLTTSDASAPLAVWADVAKTAPIYLPTNYAVPSAWLPSEVFVEGLGVGSATLGVTLTTADGTSLVGGGVTFNLTQLVVRITSPAEGADFVVDRAAPAAIVAEASWTDSTTTSASTWTVTPGPHSGVAPPPGTGRQFSFVPQPEAHAATYQPGWSDNSCGTCGAAWWIADQNTPDAHCGNGCNGHAIPRTRGSRTASPRASTAGRDRSTSCRTRSKRSCSSTSITSSSGPRSPSRAAGTSRVPPWGRATGATCSA